MLHDGVREIGIGRWTASGTKPADEIEGLADAFNQRRGIYTIVEQIEQEWEVHRLEERYRDLIDISRDDLSMNGAADSSM